MQIIEEIVLDKELFPGYTVIDEENLPQEDDFPQEKNILRGLSKMNLFVGQNNSGKSRFLRHFINNHTEETLKIKPQNLYIENCDELLKLFLQILNKNIDNKNFNIDRLLKYIKYSIYYYPINKKQQDTVNYDWKNELYKYIDTYFRPFHEERLAVFNFLTSKLSELKDSLKGSPFNTLYKFIYIPTLRGLVHLDGCDQKDSFKDLYTEKVKDIYSLTDCDVFSGLDFNKLIRGQLLGNLEERNSIQKYQEFLSKHLFNNQRVLLIPNENDSEGLKIKIGDEKEQKIHDLGDGLQTLIILTYPPFQSSKEKVLYFIEEPELSLHPGLQRQLLEAFQDDKYFGNVQFFITTHSNHLLDITLDQKDTSIYLLNKKLPDGEGTEKEPQFTIENVKHGDCRMLDTLGVSNSSVFLSNCTIWVEGITDRLYLRQYLALYWENEKKKAKNKKIDIIEFKEDTHYSFIEYSGNNITHWSFIDKDDKSTMNYESISHKIFVILDEDNPNTKTTRRTLIERHLPNDHIYTPCREIENLLSPAIIKEVLKSYKETPKVVESLKIEYTDYKNEPLGRYINGKLKKKPRKKKKHNYAAKSGTISDKLNFCVKALDYIKEWKDLSADAKKLTRKIVNFIAKSNPTHPATEQPIKS